MSHRTRGAEGTAGAVAPSQPQPSVAGAGMRKEAHPGTTSSAKTEKGTSNRGQPDQVRRDAGALAAADKSHAATGGILGGAQGGTVAQQKGSGAAYNRSKDEVQRDVKYPLKDEVDVDTEQERLAEAAALAGEAEAEAEYTAMRGGSASEAIARGIAAAQLSTMVEQAHTLYTLGELQLGTASGMDLAHKERHLSAEDFQSLFRMFREAFYRMPQWQQSAMKKEHKLF